jgi:transposase
VLSVTGATRVLVATTPVGLRGSFNRLYGLVVEQLKGDPLSGHLFVFTNVRRNRIKVIYWDGGGLWVCAKRLETGRFTWPSQPARRRVQRLDSWAGSAVEKELVSAVKRFLMNIVMLIEQT